mmetsp:Transcript_20834/g.29957  ORF Transcript_20834/g.29957 Transcript_20834/m.29957 type:complete len:806 (-) Transcript_20834:191-2608(-)|eukprot:CAMPEP_0185025390 /NCGR_PEP_ID=MMETSP1103-20130426/8370_1 /TAXON_ID=36769 /ORGANISM="Paraphysomonas bandaiensis, Strain Caron Lab Isolate" /LENGTH=805 /DNA_ID=CAMNT_0027558587 /DNA_START=15 /DNA_END=2432 /DNA_ORIENTATION=-
MSILLLLLSVTSFISVCSVSDDLFYQDISHRSVYAEGHTANWEQLPFTGINKGNSLFLRGISCFLSVSDGVLYSSSVNPTQNKIKLESPFKAWRSAYTLNGDALALAVNPNNENSFYVVTADNIEEVHLINSTADNSCGAVESVDSLLPNASPWGIVNAVTASKLSIWVASSDRGLIQVDLESGEASVVPVDDADVRSLYWVQPWQQLFVGTPTALYTLTYSQTTIASTDHEWVGAIIDTVPLDMAYEEVYDSLWIANRESVHRLTRSGMLWRYGQRQGAPTGNITSVTCTTGMVYVGTLYGVARVAGNADPTQIDQLMTHATTSTTDPWKWSYYEGHRYLPHDHTIAVVGGRVSSSAVVLAVCETGLALLESALWTLKEKSLSMGTFQNPRHNRHGLTTGVNLNEYGDLNTYVQHCDDNDGLWTSMHAMGEIYRYMVTGELEAKQLAWTAFEALELLNILPGAYPRFPARSFCLLNESETLSGCSGDVWVQSDVNPNYMWKSTTSSDEIDGHLAVLPMMYDHIASTDEEKARVYALIEGITGGIVANDLYLIDPSTGEPTHWGFWNPELVNDDPEHYSERGTNSLGILAYLASAYSVTHNELYVKVFWDLGINQGYIKNCMNAKIDCPMEDNHSDNELLFQAYHILFYALQRLPLDDPEVSHIREEVSRMVNALVPSIDRMWHIVQGERSPLWLGIYAGTCQRPVSEKDISDAVWTLRRWAIDMIVWPIKNSNRWDITESPFFPRDSSTNHLMRQIIPPAERVTTKWNADPFIFDAGSGYSEEAPYVWRLPYYLMLYNNLITDE